MKRFTFLALLFSTMSLQADGIIAVLKNYSTIERRDAKTGAFKGSISVMNAIDVGCDGDGVPPKFGPVVMRGFVGVSGWFRCLAERRP